MPCVGHTCGQRCVPQPQRGSPRPDTPARISQPWLQSSRDGQGCQQAAPWPGQEHGPSCPQGPGLRPETSAGRHRGHAPNPGGSGNAKGSREGSQPASTASGGRRNASSPRQSSLEEKRERADRHEARLGSRPLYPRGAGPAGPAVPSRPRAAAAGALPVPEPRAPRPAGARSPLTALRAGEAAGGHGGSRRRCSRCGGRDILGRAAIYSGRKRRAAALGRRSPAARAAAHAPAPRSAVRAGPIAQQGRAGRVRVRPCHRLPGLCPLARPAESGSPWGAPCQVVLVMAVPPSLCARCPVGVYTSQSYREPRYREMGSAPRVPSA